MYQINRTRLIEQMADNSFAVFFSGIAPAKSADQNLLF